MKMISSLKPELWTDGALFGSTVRGCSTEERRRCAQEVSIFTVLGLEIVLMNGLHFCMLLRGGIARYKCLNMYIYHLTLGGFALVFPLDGKCKHLSDLGLSAMASDGTKINLKATIYRKDASRIVDGCICYTCQNHTKAYINHLLNVHEMLAHILLEIHNTHHYLSFFGVIREAITEGRFEELWQNLFEKRRDHLLAASLSAYELETPVRLRA
ncbi:uncharacterized protein LOC111876940 isoform X2 [Lactuca sativa]|uniref:uncharacterized protein LOC111876940 isoform X2 n=1 Tax=Lactuca sativa TaxID=4236 RepID=UPI000CD84D92|nr:uncharacterized protein LOC111876940 isoform X2 [Lactuca sativa]